MAEFDRDLVGYGAHPPQGTWPGGASVALSMVLNVEEGSERSYAFGDGANEGLGEVPRALQAGMRDLATESVYEYGSRVGVYRMLRIFDRAGVPMTAFAAALALERNPQAAEWLVRSGHEICSHGYRWAEQWTMSREEEKAQIDLAVATFERVTGQRPVGWYSRWMRSEHTRELLVDEGGFLYDSDAYNDDVPYWTRVPSAAGEAWHLIVPYTLTYNDSFYSYGHVGSPADFLDYLKRGLDHLRAEGDGVPRILSVGLHPRLSGQAARASAVEEFLEYAKTLPDVWIATRRQIAEFWMQEHPAPSV